MEELRPGLWTWTGRHPSWTPDQGGPEGWGPEVRSYAYDAGDMLVLFDPLVEPTVVEELAGGRPIVIELTCRWHHRSTAELVEQLGAVVRSPAADAPELSFPAGPYERGDELPGGVVPNVAAYENEATLWIPAHGALVSGEALQGAPPAYRVQPDSWLDEGLTREGLRDRLRVLLELPLELLLPTHGDPVVDGANEALSLALSR